MVFGYNINAFENQKIQKLDFEYLTEILKKKRVSMLGESLCIRIKISFGGFYICLGVIKYIYI